MRLKLQELAVEPPLLLDIANSGDVAVTQNDDLIAALIDIAQQVRRDHDVHVAGITNFLNELDHAGARRRIEAVGRLIKKYQFGTMRDCLRELGKLLHAERVRSQLAVA